MDKLRPNITNEIKQNLLSKVQSFLTIDQFSSQLTNININIKLINDKSTNNLVKYVAIKKYWIDEIDCLLFEDIIGFVKDSFSRMYD